MKTAPIIKYQQGAILIIALVMLMILTLLGVSGVTTTQMQERMAGNQQEHVYAFESAEATLRVAEAYIEDSISVVTAFDTNGTDGLYDSSQNELWSLIDWDNTDGANNNEAIQVALDAGDDLDITGSYIIEHYGTFAADGVVTNLSGETYNSPGQSDGSGSTELFRITARGASASNRGHVFLQVNYAKAL